MNDCAPPPVKEDHVAYEGEMQLWDDISEDCNWNDVRNILNSSFITLEEKHTLIKYSSADAEEDGYHAEEDVFHAETEEFSNTFSYSL